MNWINVKAIDGTVSIPYDASVRRYQERNIISWDMLTNEWFSVHEVWKLTAIPYAFIVR